MKRYNPAEIEPKWQSTWKESGVYSAKDFDSKPKYVMLTEFPYPSGDGLHLGHTREYTLGDIMARHKRMQGYNVLYPMGYDAFGLPTENYAIKNKIAPQIATDRNTSNFQKQFESLGFSIDWSRSFRTTDPDYYKWTQWLFLKFYEKGLAYQDDIAINWCPKCKTGLANEEVMAGRHERCGTLVEKKQLRQWMMRITQYADRLIDGLKDVDYPSRIADQQINWIGRSVGAEVTFEVASSDQKVENKAQHEIADTLKFTPELTELVKRGVKTNTIRLEPKSAKVGDYVEFYTRDGETVTGPFAVAKVMGTKQKALKDIPLNFAGHETYASRQEQLDSFRKYYGEEISSGDIFTIYDYEVIDLISEPTAYEPAPTITVFTTRPDTLFGATFLVLAPEHELVDSLTTNEQRAAVKTYVKAAQAKSDIERQDTDREKTGVFTGSYATNPLTHEEIPIWIADYVLTGYGTGAIMAVPAHDERDGDFARKFELPIKEVVAPDFGQPLPDAVDVTGPVIVGYDPKTKEFMSLINTKNNLRWFASGGLNDGETYEQAALRELSEEAGFKNVEKLIRLGGPTYSYYFNSNKNSNRRSFSYMYLAIIDKNDQQDQALEEHEKYKVVWSGLDEIRKDLEKEQASDGGVGHWLDCLSRVKDAAACYDSGKGYEGPVYTGDGVLFDSGSFSGVPSAEARELIVQHLAREGKAKEKVNYRLRDWIFSRQHYWGEPIPIIHCAEHGAVAVPAEQLPVTLPDVENYEPTDTGESPLAAIDSWVNTTCPTCGGPAKRETDTMPNWAGSSWYYLRYFDAHNDTAFADRKKLDYWGAVDLYLGGMEHTTLHLLYSRFWHQFFYDIGLVPTPEPYMARRGQGIILAEDGRKMSKSLGNVINPTDIIDSGYGADALRLCIAFLAPYDLTTPWNSKGVAGTHRYLNRLWGLVNEFVETTPADADTPIAEQLHRVVHGAIKKVSGDLDQMGFNTAIAGLMELLNDLYKIKNDHGFAGHDDWRKALERIVRMTAPFAPHITEELWQILGHKTSVHTAAWPQWDESYLVTDTMTIAVQVNGKLRGEMTVAKDMDKTEIEQRACRVDRVQEYIGDKTPARIIYVPGRLVNIVL